MRFEMLCNSMVGSFVLSFECISIKTRNWLNECNWFWNVHNTIENWIFFSMIFLNVWSPVVWFMRFLEMMRLQCWSLFDLCDCRFVFFCLEKKSTVISMSFESIEFFGFFFFALNYRTVYKSEIERREKFGCLEVFVTTPKFRKCTDTVSSNGSFHKKMSLNRIQSN